MSGEGFSANMMPVTAIAAMIINEEAMPSDRPERATRSRIQE
jgi:hypothetical protein